jgi:hypothetical protein
MASNAQTKFDSTLERLDAVLDQQVRRIEAAEAHQAAEREAARAQRARDAMHERTEIGARYADAYRSFGSEPPAPVDDEAPSAFRRRLYNRLARKLAPDHKLASIRADDLSGQVLDNFEEILLDAAKAEGLTPSEANLPPSGEIVMRTRSDANTGGKFNEFFGTESFIKSMGREGRKVVAIVDRRTGNCIWGRPLQQAR